MKKVSDFQRVLVLQGGGSLGAYEAGAFQDLKVNQWRILLLEHP